MIGVRHCHRAFLALVVLAAVSCGGRSPGEPSPLYSTVPSRSLAVMHFEHLKPALKLLLDSSSVFRSLDYGRLSNSEMILSYDYSAALVPILAIDAGRAADDTSGVVASLLGQASAKNLHCLYTGSALERKMLLLSPSRAAIDEAAVHIAEGVSILDAQDFKRALELSEGADGRVLLRGDFAHRWLPKGLMEDIYPRKAVSSFVSQAAQWTVMDFNSVSAEGIRLRFLPDALGKSLSAMFGDLPAASCKLAAALPDSASFVLDIAFKDCRQYSAAWEKCLDARAALSKYNGRAASLRRQFGKKPADWLAGLDPVELARVRWDGHDVLLLRPRASRKTKDFRIMLIPVTFRPCSERRSAWSAILLRCAPEAGLPSVPPMTCRHGLMHLRSGRRATCPERLNTC